MTRPINLFVALALLAVPLMPGQMPMTPDGCNRRKP